MFKIKIFTEVRHYKNVINVTNPTNQNSHIIYIKGSLYIN